MKRILSLLILGSLLLVVSCFEPPNYSDTPYIKFQSVRTKLVPGSSTIDSLIISISFQDGNGDLGHSGTEDTYPFNPDWFFTLTPGPDCEDETNCLKVSFIDPTKLENVVKYSTRRTNSNYDTLPLFERPYSCENYQILYNGNQVIDTVYKQQNMRQFNFLCDLYMRNSTTSQFERFNWEINGNCPDIPRSGFNGRFDVLGKDGNSEPNLPIEGVLSFRASSNAVYTFLKGKPLRLEIRIIDRAGNYSNMVQSDVFNFD